MLSRAGILGQVTIYIVHFGLVEMARYGAVRMPLDKNMTCHSGLNMSPYRNRVNTATKTTFMHL